MDYHASRFSTSESLQTLDHVCNRGDHKRLYELNTSTLVMSSITTTSQQEDNRLYNVWERALVNILASSVMICSVKRVVLQVLKSLQSRHFIDIAYSVQSV